MSLAAASHAWKLFFPSWNFFDDFSASPRMEFRLFRPGDVNAEWSPLYPKHSTQSLWRVLFNPHGNLELFEQSQIERAADELSLLSAQALNAFSAGITYAALAERTRRRIQQIAMPTATKSGWLFQFRLHKAPGSQAREFCYVSLEHRLD